MKHAILFCLGMVAMTAVGRAENPPITMTAQKLAQQMADATIQGDYKIVIDHTYDGIVQAMGGRQGAIDATAEMFKQLKTKNVTVKSFVIGRPGEPQTEGGNTFVVVPTVVEMAIPNGRIVTKSYLLGVSSDAGKAWKFIDGSGIGSKPVIDKLMPKLPASLKLPAKEKPHLIKDK